MFDFGFILFVLGALGYVSGLLKKPWPRKVVIILFVLYLAGSFLKYKNGPEAQTDLSENQEKSPVTQGVPLGQYKIDDTLAVRDANAYTEAINFAKDNIQKGNFENALDELDAAEKSDVKNKNTGFIKLFRIQVLIDMRNFNKALEELLQIKEAELGTNEKAWYFRYFRTCYLALGNAEKANEYDEKLKELQDPLPAIGQRTKEHDCTVQGQLQDKACTPGFVMTNAAEQVCSKDYLKTDLPISRKVKREVFQEYGMGQYNSGAYKIDYLIPIELGGANNIANLWPEAVEPRPGFDEKNKAGQYLHDEVCASRISLSRAQQMIANDWVDVYKSMRAL